PPAYLRSTRGRLKWPGGDVDAPLINHPWTAPEDLPMRAHNPGHCFSTTFTTQSAVRLSRWACITANAASYSALSPEAPRRRSVASSSTFRSTVPMFPEPAATPPTTPTPAARQNRRHDPAQPPPPGPLCSRRALSMGLV